MDEQNSNCESDLGRSSKIKMGRLPQEAGDGKANTQFMRFLALFLFMISAYLFVPKRAAPAKPAKASKKIRRGVERVL